MQPVYLKRKERIAFSSRYLVLLAFSKKNWPVNKADILRCGTKNRLDRWSEKNINLLTSNNVSAYFPFSKKRYPFQQWAMKAGLHASPLKILIHPQYGLWFGFRGALAFKKIRTQRRKQVIKNICISCQHKICLHSCPVNAVTWSSFHYETCQQYLHTKKHNICRSSQCKARIACPVGKKHRYAKDMGRFFMRSLIK